MSQADLNRRLSEAIAFIQSGNRAEAYTLLLSLSQEFPHVEQVWLWLASAADDPTERIEYLRRVLSINANNQKARIALSRLTGEVPAIPEEVASAAPRRFNTRSMVTIGMAALILFILVRSALVTNITLPTPIPTRTRTPSRTFTPSITYTASVTPGGPTFTQVGFQTLPPSWTPEPSPTPSNTLTPSVTLTPSQTFTAPPSATPWPTVTPRSTSTPKA